ncbi:hypothetical protein HYPSUDRAFT_209133 [Hypholoma sublateritium FD-334 SS-4]|uniref:Uncharacterized protein n=1 Tax=Hypholoma sublateritium (strain FD-334 SS-4) TaxID=945553 RepID=A0A0D2NZR4_HYPSF|nr:hypothetical protein HYPSUDRAFT_209133 [Hypholoma sublateritium FD-334 SS-4]
MGARADAPSCYPSPSYDGSIPPIPPVYSRSTPLRRPLHAPSPAGTPPLRRRTPGTRHPVRPPSPPAYPARRRVASPFPASAPPPPQPPPAALPAARRPHRAASLPARARGTGTPSYASLPADITAVPALPVACRRRVFRLTAGCVDALLAPLEHRSTVTNALQAQRGRYSATPTPLSTYVCETVSLELPVSHHATRHGAQRISRPYPPSRRSFVGAYGECYLQRGKKGS